MSASARPSSSSWFLEIPASRDQMRGVRPRSVPLHRPTTGCSGPAGGFGDPPAPPGLLEPSHRLSVEYGGWDTLVQRGASAQVWKNPDLTKSLVNAELIRKAVKGMSPREAPKFPRGPGVRKRGCQGGREIWTSFKENKMLLKEG